MPVGLIIGLVAVIAVIALATASYVKVKPNEAFIITGPKKQRIVVGKATLRIPFLERIDIVDLDIMQIDIKTNDSVPTNEFIDIFVDGVANIKVKSDEENIKKAGQLFLTADKNRIKQIAQEVFEGNMREIVGRMKLVELVQDREKFAEEVVKSVMQDMEKMGFEVLNITIQNFRDDNDVIKDLGIDNIMQIRKDAAIAKAIAEQEVKVESSKAREIANAARIEADLKIEKQNTDLAKRKAELKREVETENATADAAYSIREAEEAQRINIAKQNAEIARREKEIELNEKEVEVTEKMLEAEVKKTAEAKRYAAQQNADADLYVRTKEAEARLAEETRQAEAIKIKADADRQAVLFEAEAIKAKGEAEAQAILAKGLADAEAIEKKAQAMKLMEEAAVLQLVLDSKVIPEMVGAAAAPLAQTEKIVMYGEGNSAKLSKDVMHTTTNIIEGIEQSTGFDVKSLLAGIAGTKLLGSINDDE